MDVLTVINEAFVLVGSIDPAGVPDAALPSVLAAAQAHVQIVQARVLALMTECGSRNLPSSLGAAHLVPWAADVLKVKRSTVRGMQSLTKKLSQAPMVAVAYRAGRITDQQARLMADTVAALPKGCEPLVLARSVDLGPDELVGVLRELSRESWIRSALSSARRTRRRGRWSGHRRGGVWCCPGWTGTISSGSAASWTPLRRLLSWLRWTPCPHPVTRRRWAC